MTLDRLGEAPAFGFTLLELLGHAGWSVAITAAFAGGDVDGGGQAKSLVIASKNGYEVRRTGTVAEVATEVFKEAVRVQRLCIRDNVQLRLVA